MKKNSAKFVFILVNNDYPLYLESWKNDTHDIVDAKQFQSITAAKNFLKLKGLTEQYTINRATVNVLLVGVAEKDAK